MSAGPGSDRQLMISARHVGVSYWLKQGALRRKRYWALKDISFDLYKGESLGIIGKNGCGKSTLLRLLANTMCPDCGELVGVDTIRTSLLSLQLGFVNYLPGRENAVLSGMFLGMTKREIESRMDDIIEFSELGEFIDQPLSTYSSGMRARLGFAVAFQLEPDVLLVDEVTGVGDLSFREKSNLKMRERLNSRDTTIVFVSHQANQVASLCDRAIWIDEGVVKASGGVDEVIAAYTGNLSAQKFPDLHETPDTRRGDNVFLRVKGEKALFVASGDTIKPVRNMEMFYQMGGIMEEVIVLPKELFEKIKGT